MKPSRILFVFVSSVFAFAATGKTPTPKPSPNPSPSPTSTSKSQPSPPPEILPSPMDLPTASAATADIRANQTPPNPILYLLRTEAFTIGGKNWIRYRYNVLNKNEYPAEMFAAAPGLPPCGTNTNASRTWVDFFDSTGKRLYGFCALTKPDDLGKIWIAFEEDVVPPSYVYIELNDRQTNTKYKSNLADTTL